MLYGGIFIAENRGQIYFTRSKTSFLVMTTLDCMMWVVNDNDS
jgi:hypothetical protein